MRLEAGGGRRAGGGGRVGACEVVEVVRVGACEVVEVGACEVVEVVRVGAGEVVEVVRGGACGVVEVVRAHAVCEAWRQWRVARGSVRRAPPNRFSRGYSRDKGRSSRGPSNRFRV